MSLDQTPPTPDPPTDPRIARAAAFARERHAGQPRKGTDRPYIVHPEGVARILAAHYPGRTDLEVAGWLHDTLEDTATSPDELDAEFGPEVCRLVVAVTKNPDDKGAPWHPPTDPDVMRLKAADALNNVTETVDGLRRGEPIFKRFKGGKTKVKYWREIADASRDLLGDEPMAVELDAAVTEAEAYAAAIT